jgi:hypothetical protein
MAVFASGIVLLLGIWGGKRARLSIDINEEMKDLHICMKILKDSETRWRSVGRLWSVVPILVFF